MASPLKNQEAAFRRGLKSLRAASRLHALEARVQELEARLDHERLYPVEWVNRRVRDAVGDVVRSGPSTGLEYPDWAMTEVDLYSPKVLGTYEDEIHAALETLLERRPRQVINIGAAEGYYAVGLAGRLPDATVHAFELDERLRSQLKTIAAHNGVADRVRIHGECDLRALEALAGPDTLIVSDCEGAELVLLDPVALPALMATEMLVETHDLLVEGATQVIADRFTATHFVGRADSTPRFVDDVPGLDFMPLVSQQLAVSEFRRGPQAWLTLRRRA
jgi:protein-L-isoaspartate O-methyltransferase